jgi:UDPglucose 6-dehydrogenase
MHELGGSLVGKTVAVLGLTFKANTDDTRQSPAIAVIERLIGRGAKVVAFDPLVSTYSLPGLKVVDSPKTAASEADALVVLTEWPEFGKLKPADLLAVMRGTCVVDTRNILNKTSWQAAGAIFPDLKNR